MAYEILVVDDDPDIRQIISVVLNEMGYGVRLAKDRHEAARLAEEHTPDLVLMDLLIPLQDGISLAEQLKAGPCSGVPIIAMSASDPMIERARAQACFEGWLPKPFALETLLHYVAIAGDAWSE